MRAGALRHRVSLQSVGSTYDSYGDLSNSWSTDATVWELSEVITHRILVRYRASVTAQGRILFGSRVFQIESVRDWQERTIFLEILAKEVTT